MNKTLAAWLILIVSVFLAPGCSQSGVTKVTGQVLLDDKPLAGADVRFVPKENRTLGEFGGQTDADGNFSIAVADRGMIARPGTYVALVTKGVTPGMPAGLKKPPKTDEELKEAMKGTAPGLATGSLPQQYGDPARSPFEVEIKLGTTQLAPFKLVSKQP